MVVSAVWSGLGILETESETEFRIYSDFHTQPSVGFTENCPEKRKHPMKSSGVDKNALLMSEVSK